MQAQNPANPRQLSKDEAQLILIAVFVLETALSESSYPQIQFHILRELIHAKAHFGLDFDVSMFLIEQSNEILIADSSSVISRIYEACHASL